jgi:hypothetical protein
MTLAKRRSPTAGHRRIPSFWQEAIGPSGRSTFRIRGVRTASRRPSDLDKPRGSIVQRVNELCIVMSEDGVTGDLRIVWCLQRICDSCGCWGVRISSEAAAEASHVRIELEPPRCWRCALMEDKEKYAMSV